MRKYLVIVLLLTSLFANSRCNHMLFSFRNNSNSGVTLYSFLKELVVDNCNMSIVYADDLVEQRLKSMPLGDVSVRDYTLKQFLDLLISNNNLFYTIKDDTIKISYVKTKTFHVDYISSTRTGTATFKASSSGDNGDTNSIDSKYEFNFWDTLSQNLRQILNVADNYRAKNPIIDKNAGLVTITATKRQLERVEKYIKEVNSRLHKQIIIDVKIYAVDLAKSHQTGINWSSLEVGMGAPNAPLSAPLNVGNLVGSHGHSIFSSAVFRMSALLNFLATQGNVNSISNPKIATLNNQKAIISVGDTINYRYPTKVVLDQNGNPQTEYAVENKFVGILLDITPEISDNGTIILRINPTISAFRDETQLSNPARQLAPDTTDNKLSTVVRMKDGQTLILGGLITSRNSLTENGVPILKEIPVVKYLFSSKSEISKKRELVFVVTPHIVDLNKKATLQGLGF